MKKIQKSTQSKIQGGLLPLLILAEGVVVGLWVAGVIWGPADY